MGNSKRLQGMGMNRFRRIVMSCVLVFLAACGGAETPASPAASPSAPPPATAAPLSEASPTAPAPSPRPTLPPFGVDWTQPFGVLASGGEMLKTWPGGPYGGEDIPLPLDLARIANPEVLAGLTAEQKAFLAANGFVVIHSQEAQFADIRMETAWRTGQPYYLTVDAAFHALHLLFDDLLKAVEREYLHPQMIALTRAALEQVRAALPEVQGASVEADTRQALAYLSVALKLFDPQAEVDPAVADLVSQQVAQIMAAGGWETSALFPGFEDDYSAYQPGGHYAGDPALEAYFRGMTWYGRVHFRLRDPQNPHFSPSRLPLVVTLALRQAQVDGRPAAQVWGELHEMLTFMLGPSDDAGPLEYAALMDAVYGPDVAMPDLADEARWQEFLARSGELPPPQVNSLLLLSSDDLAQAAGWRFMGQRFTLDAFILQNLVFDRVQPRPDGVRRELPSGLDVMAALGSQAAYRELEAQGATAFPGYTQQMRAVQQAVEARSRQQWMERWYDAWLYAFRAVVQPRDEAYPAYMRSPAWAYKDLNAALGSWAELKHDTALYTKMPESLAGGGPPTSGPAPSLVEPSPQAFYRLAYAAKMLSCGLQMRVLRQGCMLLQSAASDPLTAGGYIDAMGGLGMRFAALGDIAAKELAGVPLEAADYELIAECLGLEECLGTPQMTLMLASEVPPVPVVASVSGAGQAVLQAAVGNVDRIYVVAPLEGGWKVAQGGVFSYYEFASPRGSRLDDDAWRARIAQGTAPLPAWAGNFVLPGGQPVAALAFRVGDVYYITEAGDRLNLRARPSLNGAVLMQLNAGDYLHIVDGPVQADGYTWWKVQPYTWGGEEAPAGWAVEDREWYARSVMK